MAQTTSELWKTLWRSRGTRQEFAFDINGVWYGPESEIDHSVDSGLFEEFIANVKNNKIDFQGKAGIDNGGKVKEGGDENAA